MSDKFVAFVALSVLVLVARYATMFIVCIGSIVLMASGALRIEGSAAAIGANTLKLCMAILATNARMGSGGNGKAEVVVLPNPVFKAVG